MSTSKHNSSTIDIHRGNELYDPYEPNDDGDAVDHHSITISQHEQVKNHSDLSKQDAIRINNGTRSIDEQPARHRSKSLVNNRTKHSDRRSRSPYHRSHHSSDRKRLRPSSPDSITTSENNTSKSKRLSHTDSEENKWKSHPKHRSSSKSPSPSNSKKSSSVTANESNEMKSYNDSENDKVDNHIHRQSSRRDEHYSSRSHSSRYYHPSSSKYSSRDHSSSTHQTYVDHRRPHDSFGNLSNSSRLSSAHSDQHSNDAKAQETSNDDRNRIINRLKNVNETNTPIITNNLNANKTSSNQVFNHTNGGSSQRSRSNLIQIVTTEADSLAKQKLPTRLSSIIKKPDATPTKPATLPSETESNNAKSKNGAISSKTNGTTADDMLMEEMLLQEEQEQIPVKSIDLDSLTIPDSSNQKTNKPDEHDKPPVTTVPSTSSSTTTTSSNTTTTPSIITSVSSLTPSPTKKPYTLYKVPNTNHTTPPLSSRHKKSTKTDSINPQPDPTVTTKSSIDDHSQRTSLDDRLSTIFGVSASSTSTTNEQTLDSRSNLTQALSTPSDKSTASPQDIPPLISSLPKKVSEHSSTTKKANHSDERRSSTSKHYTSEWLATQKPEDAAAPNDELPTLPPLVTLPTLVSSQPTSSIPPSAPDTSKAAELEKLSVLLGILTQPKSETTAPVQENDDAVPDSAKHLERLERRKEREKRQAEIAAIAKEALRPAFKKRLITKEEYKEIMKKVVTKATDANEVDRNRIGKMIDAYVGKYRLLHQQKQQQSETSQTLSSTSNGKST